MTIEYKIGDFLKRFKRPITLIPDEEYKLVTISSKHRGVKLRGLKKGALIKSKMYEVKSGDFIVSGIDARNGAFGIIPEELDGAIVTNDFWYFEIDEKIILKKLFLELTATTWFDEICTRGSDGTTNRVRLQKDRFFNQKVILPHFEEQETLLQHLLSFKTAKTDLSKEISYQKNLVKRLKQSTLQDAIQGKLTKDWRNENPNIEPASDLLKRIKAEKAKLIKEKKIKKEKPLPKISKEEIPFELPENWVWCRLGEIIVNSDNLNIQKVYSPDKIVNYVDIDAINNKTQKIGAPKIEPVSNLSSRARRVLKKGNIMYSLVRPYLHNLAIVEQDKEDYIGSTGFAVFDCLLIENKYIFWLLMSKYIETLYLGFMDGFNSPSITKDQFNNTLIPLPPQEEQSVLIKKIKEFNDKCISLKQEITRSGENINILMQAVLKEAFESKENKKTEVIVLPTLQDIEEKHFVKRKMLASYIINKSANDEKFGDTKFEKLLHLSDYHILKRNLGQEYKQKAAGPYDNKFTVPFFNQTIKAEWFYKQRLGKMNRIVLGNNNIKSQSTYDFFTAEELQEIDKLISTFKSFDYKIPEIISTLYAVWNNRIIRKQDISDENLKQDFLNWDKGKAQYVYPKDRVTPAIGWMKKNEFVPDGWGKIIEPPKSKNKKNLQT